MRRLPLDPVYAPWVTNLLSAAKALQLLIWIERSKDKEIWGYAHNVYVNLISVLL